MTAAPSFPSLLTLRCQGREGLPRLADRTQPWGPHLDAALLPCLCQVLAAAAKLRNQSQKHRHLHSTSVESGVRLKGSSGPPAWPFLFPVIHTVKGVGIVNKAEIDIFMELSCFFHDPADVGNLISDSFAFL